MKVTGVPQLRLAYLDGLRAAAALYVVLFHAVLGFAPQLSGPLRLLRLLFGFGHEAVAIFIVLSGYCLMLPVSRSKDGSLRGGFGAYLSRRAFRILPPYFGALLLSLALIRWVPVLGRGGSGTIWDDSLPGIGIGPIASHLLLIHNWVPRWAYQINGPLWSVASEWQIYFFFPLLLLPLRKRFGAGAMLLIAGLLGYAPLLFARAGAMRAVPWYLLLFATGMLAADVGFSTNPAAKALRERVGWQKAAALLWVACAVGGTAGARIWFRFLPLTDLLVGCASAALLVHCTGQAAANRPGLMLRIFEARPLVAIGHFSYSLYLTHLPIVALSFFGLRALGISRQPPLVLSMVPVSLCASLAFAYVFYWLVERHFIKARPSPVQPRRD